MKSIWVHRVQIGSEMIIAYVYWSITVQPSIGQWNSNILDMPFFKSILTHAVLSIECIKIWQLEKFHEWLWVFFFILEYKPFWNNIYLEREAERQKKRRTRSKTWTKLKLGNFRAYNICTMYTVHFSLFLYMWYGEFEWKSTKTNTNYEVPVELNTMNDNA